MHDSFNRNGAWIESIRIRVLKKMEECGLLKDILIFLFQDKYEAEAKTKRGIVQCVSKAIYIFSCVR